MAKRILVQHKDKDWFKGEVVDTVVYISGSNSDIKFVVALPDGSFSYDSIFHFKRIKTLKENKK